jgi:hypothetical protein
MKTAVLILLLALVLVAPVGAGTGYINMSTYNASVLSLANASAYYQPLSGMSAYQTISNSSTFFQTIANVSTREALFQTVAGMTSYQTIANDSVYDEAMNTSMRNNVSMRLTSYQLIANDSTYDEAMNTSMRNNVSIALSRYQTISNDSAYDKGYTIQNQFLTGTWANSTTYYWGMQPAAVATTAGYRKTYIQKGGTIRAADIYIYSGTAGSNTAWPIYIVKNGDTGQTNAIGSVSAAANERHWSNTSLNIAVAAGDYIEIMSITGLIPTKPATSIGGGYIYIE